ALTRGAIGPIPARSPFLPRPSREPSRPPPPVLPVLSGQARERRRRRSHRRCAPEVFHLIGQRLGVTAELVQLLPVHLHREGEHPERGREEHRHPNTPPRPPVPPRPPPTTPAHPPPPPPPRRGATYDATSPTTGSSTAVSHHRRSVTRCCSPAVIRCSVASISDFSSAISSVICLCWTWYISMLTVRSSRSEISRRRSACPASIRARERAISPGVMSSATPAPLYCSGGGSYGLSTTGPGSATNTPASTTTSFPAGGTHPGADGSATSPTLCPSPLTPETARRPPGPAPAPPPARHPAADPGSQSGADPPSSAPHRPTPTPGTPEPGTTGPPAPRPGPPPAPHPPAGSGDPAGSPPGRSSGSATRSTRSAGVPGCRRKPSSAPTATQPPTELGGRTGRRWRCFP